MKKKKALITGITGQDGHYLSRLLLDKGYEVHGIIRRSSSFNTGRIDDIFSRLSLYHGDLTDPIRTTEIIKNVAPQEIYNLAAQSHVRVSFEIPYYTTMVDAVGSLNVFEAVRSLGLREVTKIYQASSSEMFGSSPPPQNEKTPMAPCSPYGVSKLYAYWMAKNYRDAHDMFISNGILFNHESPYRGETFVTHKVTKAAVRIAAGKQDVLWLGNLEATRDWGHAKDYVEAMWRMLQQDKPDDYVVATGESHSVRELVEYAFNAVGIQLEWRDRGSFEFALSSVTNDCVVAIDSKYYRPTEVNNLCGDATKAKIELGWNPTYTFKTLIDEMIQHDQMQELTCPQK